MIIKLKSYKEEAKNLKLLKMRLNTLKYETKKKVL